MLGLLTTSRKALAAAGAGFLSPLYVLVQSDLPITWRAVMGCAIAGGLAGFAIYEVPNTEEYAPVGRHHAVDE